MDGRVDILIGIIKEDVLRQDVFDEYVLVIFFYSA
jgi:hypothetical protein